MMQQSSSQPTAVFELGKELTFEEARGRFKEGQMSLEYLLDHYDEICMSKDGGGDNVRRYLGTVGTASGLYGVSKVMKTLLSEIADDNDFDVVEFTEKMDEINSALMSADGSAYSTIFIVSSPNGEISEKAKRYFIEAKIEIIRAMEAMNDIAELMNIR